MTASPDHRPGTQLAPVASAPPVRAGSAHEVEAAVRDQLVADIGTARLEALATTLDRATFGVVLHWLSSYQRRSRDTKRGYADDVVRVAEWFVAATGRRHADLLTGLHFDTVTAWSLYARSRGDAARTQRRCLSALSSLFEYARRAHRLAVENPVHLPTHAPPLGTSTDGRPPGATRVLELSDVAALTQACSGAEDHLVFELLFTQGLRESEVVSLDIDNLDRTTVPPLLSVQRKGGRWVRRRLSDAAVRHLDTYLGERGSGPVLVHPRTGLRRDRHQIISITRRLARRGGLPQPQKVTPHVLRATAITTLLDRGKPLQEVQEWAGHAHASTTRGYWERRHSVQRDAALSSSLIADLADATAGLGGR
ncbi:recombinase XerD [Saccharomonospora piscinae]|uniref:Recombinase XerD n=1 Tax=Saccharomonospora piscinae TaxID=687388 RepID=A0A1V9AC46_SACPI|nr:tyrosine-type recombinase/integrase [Saccharomonospora piscinae]OQO94628.1 recombinase XerD [Saccharomonospora piscinae]TLW94675.1 recombinase XerD [Saccharomonospora piscinae]